MRRPTAFGLSIAATAAISLSPDVLPDLPRFDPTRATGPSKGEGESRAATMSTDRIETLPQVVDAGIPGLLEQHHIVGAAIAVVHGDRLI